MSGPARLLPELLERSSGRTPHAPALEAVAPDGAVATWSYERLSDAADRIASCLVESGVRPGDRVAVGLRRSPEAIAALFGSLRAGAVFVPLDPGSPAARRARILADSGATALVTPQAAWRELASGRDEGGSPRVVIVGGAGEREPAKTEGGARVICWSEAMTRPRLARPVPRRPSDLAYVLYTSGSTGTPKGVMISHENALAFTSWACAAFGLTASDRVAGVAPLHFDLSTFDLYSTLEAGATLQLVPRQVALFPAALAGFLERHRSTVAYLVPSTITGLLLKGGLGSRDLSSLRTLLFAGEVLPARHLSLLMQSLAGVSMYNLYGPTETNVCSFYRVQPADALRDQPLPIGSPASGDALFALDEKGRRIDSPGVEGELYAAGPTVALGYWGAPPTAGSGFLESHPMAPDGARVYRTGDIVSLDRHGQWLFHGRRDHMVKSRGYRIELGEIEAALYAHAAIAEAVALPLPDEEVGNRIHACVVVRPGVDPPEPTSLLRHCADRLPRYMVPESLDLLASLPRTSSGKIDRARLLSAARERRTA